MFPIKYILIFKYNIDGKVEIYVNNMDYELENSKDYYYKRWDFGCKNIYLIKKYFVTQCLILNIFYLVNYLNKPNYHS